MIVVFVAKSKEGKLPAGLTPIPITRIEHVSNVISYMNDGDHVNHLNWSISPMYCLNTETQDTFLDRITADLSYFKKLHPHLIPHKYTGEIAEHLIFCFPEGTNLAENERREYIDYVLERIAPNHDALVCWHKDDEFAGKLHAHALVSNFDRKYFWRPRVREIRLLDHRRDYFAKVLQIAREGVTVLNLGRENHLENQMVADDLPAPILRPIPTLKEVRSRKAELREREVEPSGTSSKKNFIEVLARACGYWLPERIDSPMNEAIESAMRNQNSWKIKSFGKRCIYAIPIDPTTEKKKSYPLSKYWILDEVREMFLERATKIEHSHPVIVNLAETIGATLYLNPSDTKQSRLLIDSSLRNLGWETRISESKIEARENGFGLYIADFRTISKLVIDTVDRQLRETRLQATSRPQSVELERLVEKFIENDSSNSLDSKRDLAVTYLRKGGYETKNAKDDLLQIRFINRATDPWNWISVKFLTKDLEEEAKERKRKAEQKKKAREKAHAQKRERTTILPPENKAAISKAEFKKRIDSLLAEVSMGPSTISPIKLRSLARKHRIGIANNNSRVRVFCLELSPNQLHLEFANSGTLYEIIQIRTGKTRSSGVERDYTAASTKDSPTNKDVRTI